MGRNDASLSAIARFAALSVALLATVSLAAQFAVSYVEEGTGSVRATLWWMAAYFTVLTNGLVVVVFGRAARRGAVTARSVTAVTLAIVLVALVYHAVLSGLRQLEGLGWWSDQGLHSAVPTVVALWWLAYAPKTVSRADLPSWLIWPAVYAVYAILRGVLTGFWAYPFLNADVLGWAVVASNVVALIAAFVVAGLGFIAVARWIRGRSVR